jgi:peroxisomal membrane protein 4
MDRLKRIFDATFTHSRNLAKFVAIYKTLLCVFRHLRQRDSGINALLAGAIGGYMVFGEFNPINSQINMYIMSRVIFGSVRTLLKHEIVPEYEYAFQVYAAVGWALVMYLFNYQKGTLQKSLISSMTYLYLDSEKWPNPDQSSIKDWFMESA